MESIGFDSNLGYPDIVNFIVSLLLFFPLRIRKLPTDELCLVFYLAPQIGYIKSLSYE